MKEYVHILNEVYFGRTNHLLNALDHLKKFRTRYAHGRKVFMAIPGVENDKDWKEFINEIAKEFNMESLSMVILYTDDPNAFTILGNFRPYDAKCVKFGKDGYKFTNEAHMNCVYAITAGMLFNNEYTDEEVLAVILHETGHNFQRYISNRMMSFDIIQNVISMILISYVSITTTGDLRYLVSKTIGSAIYSNVGIGFFNKTFNDVISKDDVRKFYSLVMIIANIPKNILFSIGGALLPSVPNIYDIIDDIGSSIMKNLVNISGHQGEVIGDKFAAYYGFGPELAVFFKKMETPSAMTGLGYYARKCPLYGHMIYFLSLPLQILNDIKDVHPNTADRVLNVSDALRHDLKMYKSQLNPKVVKQIESDLNRLEKNANRFDNASKDISNPSFLRTFYNLFIEYIGGDLKHKITKPIYDTDNEITKQYNKLKEDTDMIRLTLFESSDEDKKDKEMDEAITKVNNDTKKNNDKMNKEKEEKNDDELEDYTSFKDDDDEVKDNLPSTNLNKEFGMNDSLNKLRCVCYISKCNMLYLKTCIRDNSPVAIIEMTKYIDEQVYELDDCLEFCENLLKSGNFRVPNILDIVNNNKDINIEREESYDITTSINIINNTVNIVINTINNVLSNFHNRPDIMNRFGYILSKLESLSGKLKSLTNRCNCCTTESYDLISNVKIR